MHVHRLGADMKLRRARRTLSQIECLQEEYLGSGAIRLVVTHVPDGTDMWRVRVAHDLPTEYAALVGKAFHFARSALDDLAVALVVACGRAPRDTRFPIAASAHLFDEELSTCLRRADPLVREAVRSVSPWKGADDKLWELNTLNTAERRLPVIHLGQALGRTAVRSPSPLRVLRAPAPTTRTRFPLRDGSVFWFDESVSSDTDQDVLLESTVRIVFGEGELVRGQPVIESLDMLIAHAASVVDDVCAAAARR